MDNTAKFRNLFLVMDTKMEGVLNEASVLMALQSVGYVVPNDVKSSIKPMNLQQFVEFGNNLAKKLPQDGGVGDLFKSLTGSKSRNIDTSELKQVMENLKSFNPKDLDNILKLVDPKGTGKFDCESLTNAFKA